MKYVMNQKIYQLRITVIAIIALILSGCAALHTSIAKKDLDVQTKFSTSIFVDPVVPLEKKIHLEVRSGVQEFEHNAFRAAFIEQIINNGNGYSLIDNPTDAQYSMSMFVRNLENNFRRQQRVTI